MKTNQKLRAYQKRKRKTNVSLKSNLPDFRCVVNKSLKHMRAQLIDANGNVVISSSDLKDMNWTKTERAHLVGKTLAEQAIAKKITSCVFDRNGNIYHGRVKAVCEAMREAGMTI